MTGTGPTSWHSPASYKTALKFTQLSLYYSHSLVAKANALFKAYGLQGVPNFIVNGKYVVGGETARTLQIVNKLLEQDRGGKK